MIFFEMFLPGNKQGIDILRKMIPTHWTSNLNIATMLKVIFIDSIILDHRFSLMFDPKF